MGAGGAVGDCAALFANPGRHTASDAVGECATRIINLGARLVAEPTPERLVAFDRLVTHFRGELGETGFLVAQHCIGSARYTLGINIVCGGA